MSLNTSSVAVVGLAAKTPKGNGLRDLWEGLMEYDSTIRTVCYGKEDTPFGFASVMPPDIRDGFDPTFWELTPAQASEIDPQTRWIMEGVWNAMLDAGFLTRESLAEKCVGVFCGIMNNDAPEIRTAASMDFALNSTAGSVAGFVSHAFGFRGPSADINTMCSSGMRCLEMATESLRSGACDVAFVAAANWVGGAANFQRIGSINALSKTGIQDCLGKEPDGYVRGEACVVLALQRSAELPAGRSPRCIIEAVASTHHGRGGLYPTSGGSMSTNVAQPTPTSYIDSYEKCFEKSPSLAKDDVVYVEMHATGTSRGDKAEIDSIVDFFGDGRDVESKDSKVLWLGGNKSMFGHTEPVAGLLSIAKILLAIENGIMPPTLFMTDHATTLEDVRHKKKIELAVAPLPMETIMGSLFAVTASGMSGITTHAIIRPPVASDLQVQETQSKISQLWPPMLVLSTHSADSCKQWRDSFASDWENEVIDKDLILPEKDGFHLERPAAASCTVVSFDGAPLSKAQVRGLPIIRNPPHVIDASTGKAGVILGFGGIGLVQYGVGRRAYADWPSFRIAVNEVDQLFRDCDVTIFRNRSVAQLCGIVYQEKGPILGSELPTELMQATTFLVQYAEAAAIIRDFNVEVEAVIGHSFGEIVAGVVSGAITLNAGVMLTALRTQVCLEIEEQCNGESMAMSMAVGISYEQIMAALENFAGKDDIHLTGIIAENEFLLSGTRRAVEDFTAGLVSEFEATVMRIESTVAFHSPLVSELGSRVETLVEGLIERQQLFEQSDSGQVKCFMTSTGGQTTVSQMRSACFWKSSVVDKVLLKDVMSELEVQMGASPVPIIDLSPRGLYSNWLRRNGNHHGLSRKTVSAPTFSWDVFRVLQHFRNRSSKSETSHELERAKMLPAYPFAKQICNDIPHEFLVRAVGDTKPTSTVFSRKTCLETVYKNIDVSRLVDTIDPSSCVGIDLVNDGTPLWNAVWGLDDQRHSVIKSFDGSESFLENHIWQSGTNTKFTLLVCGPLNNSTPKTGFEDAKDMSKALDFVDGLQKLVFRQDSPLKGLIFITDDASHPSFEFCSGSFASLRLQAPSLKFVSTVRVIQEENSKGALPLDFNPGAVRVMLNAAAAGEVLMQIGNGEGVKGCRLVPAENTMTWENFDWIKKGCLYVISGSASSIALTMLPFLASIGVKHFLLLINRRQPSQDMINLMYRLGAKCITIKRCSLVDEAAIRDAAKSAVGETGTVRVAGCFHLAGIDTPKVQLPTPKEDLVRVLDVKYKAHITLLSALDLRNGDIFCVPGSFSTIMGSGGIAYAATNHACRALQLRVAGRLFAPYPAMALSHSSFDNTSLVDTERFSQQALEKINGMAFVSSQTFNLGMTSSFAVPTAASKDLAFIRMKTPKMHEYLNTTSPNRLLDDLLLIETQEETSPIGPLFLKTQNANVANDSRIESSTKVEATAIASVEDALNDAIAKVTGLSESEVKSIANSSVFFEDAYSIDSISSIRLAKRIQDMGFNIMQETIVTGTYGEVLEQMKESAPLLQPPVVETSQPKFESDQKTEVSKFGSQVSEQDTPVPVNLMKVVSRGHDTLRGGIVPSLWYAMVGLMMCKSRIKVTLFRMAALGESFDWKVTKDANGDGETTMTFLAASGSQREPVVQAQVSSTKEALEAVPSFDRGPASAYFDKETIYGQFCQLAGFAFKSKYQSLQSITVFGGVNVANEQNCLYDCVVEAEGHVELSDDPHLGRAEAVMITMDAALQAPGILSGAMMAPARFVLNMNVSVEECEKLVRHAHGRFSIVATYLSTARTRLSAVSTVRIDGTIVFTVEAIFKPTPIAVGARFYPQFFARPPVHTLVCFHMGGGTSRSYDEVADLVAPQLVRVLSIDFARHGRRSQQTDDEVVVTTKQMHADLAPWIIPALQGEGGSHIPFSLVGVSAGGACAYEMLQSCLLPEGLIPDALLVVLSQPPFRNNPHVERTYDATPETISRVLAYYSVLCNCDLSFLEDEETAVDRMRSVLSVMHEITNSTGGSPHTRPKVDIPLYAVGLETDTVVAYEDVQLWKDIATESAWRQGGFVTLSPDKEYQHFLTLTGKSGEAFSEILMENGILHRILVSAARDSAERPSSRTDSQKRSLSPTTVTVALTGKQ